VDRLPNYADWIWLAVALAIVGAVALLAHEIRMNDLMAARMRG